MSFDAMWSALESVGRHPRTGGYRRFAWTRDDTTLREWFAGEAAARGLDLTQDRAGNQWAWWGDPDAAVAAGRPGLVLGSHLDSVPDGGAYDGPLGGRAACGGGLGEAADPSVPGDGVRDAGGRQGAHGRVRFSIHDDHPRLRHMSFDAMWAALETRRPSPAHRRLPAVRLDPRRHDAAGVVRRRGRGAGARPGRRTGPATSGPGGATPTPPWRPAGRDSSSARTWTRCPTAAPSTARSGWCPPSRRSTC